MALSAFGKAFADARKNGQTEFTFGGKQFNTRMKGEAAPQREPVHIDAEAGMTRGTRRGAGAGRGFVNPEMPKSDPRDLEAGMSRGTRSYTPDTSEVDRVKNLMEAGGVKTDRVDEAGEPYKKGGKVKGWGKARGARAAKFY